MLKHLKSEAMTIRPDDSTRSESASEFRAGPFHAIGRVDQRDTAGVP
jgi:hypothetical protein